jgi:hypothetical protein
MYSLLSVFLGFALYSIFHFRHQSKSPNTLGRIIYISLLVKIVIISLIYCLFFSCGLRFLVKEEIVSRII